jgi:hypothetical protein
MDKQRAILGAAFVVLLILTTSIARIFHSGVNLKRNKIRAYNTA